MPPALPLAMDRALPASSRRDRLRRRWLRIAIGALALLAVVYGSRRVLEPSVDRADILTARVERGEVVAAISATGLVVPAREQVVSSTFPTAVVEVLAQNGAEVRSGDPILRLDSRDLELEISGLTERLALAENERETRRLDLQRSLDEARSRHALLEIDSQSRAATLARQEALAAHGLIAEGDLLEARLDVERTTAELEQVERVMANAEAAARAAIERIDLETSILGQQLAGKRRLLSEATVAAPRDGVVTWLLDEVGASVATGAPVARVADFSAFRVEAGVSDFYAPQLRGGLPARVTVGDEVLGAEVAAVLPTVEGGTMELVLDLAEPAHPLLRPRLRVDVEVVTGSAPDALSVRNGPGVGAATAFLYRIEDGWAVKSPVRLGLASRQRVEIVSGLQEGDEVIVSDIRELHHLDRFRVE